MVSEIENEDVRKVIIKHLPSCLSIYLEDDRAGFYTKSILYAQELGSEMFGQSRDGATLQEMERSLAQVLRQFDELSDFPKHNLSHPFDSFLYSESPSPETEQFRSIVAEFRKRASKLRKWGIHGGLANEKRNWKAMSIAFSCQNC